MFLRSIALNILILVTVGWTQVQPRQTQVAGKIVVRNGAPLPSFGTIRIDVMIEALTFSLSEGTGPSSPSTQIDTTNLGSNGNFTVRLPEGRRQLKWATPLPPGYALESMTYGTTDAQAGSLQLQVDPGAPAELTITLRFDSPLLQVSGRVLTAGKELRETDRVVLTGCGFAENGAR